MNGQKQQALKEKKLLLVIMKNFLIRTARGLKTTCQSVRDLSELKINGQPGQSQPSGQAPTQYARQPTRP